MPDLEDPESPSPELLSTRDSIRGRLLRDTLHGEIDPFPTEGEPLSENDVKARYGLNSRMPVRMALAVLAGEGLFRQRARHGYWLVKYDLYDIEQILRMRSDVEAMVAETLCRVRISEGTDSDDASAAERRVTAWNQALQSHDDMGRLIRRASEEGAPPDLEASFGDLDTQLHASLARAADYDIAARHIVGWRNQVRIFALQNHLRYREALPTIHAEHAALIDMLRQGDAVSAVAKARSHVEQALIRIQSLSLVAA